ncbi:Cysteine-rich receptor-like protein kinase 26 [Morella rubra]|uniref:Cysteine-rich receptor-like protein kinase 26 n=1 Tax=Morella rubra TaxID=262757 RepID=A0A6A1UM02_9ROSI|nr:Cysteine-rich receptor-like protein kinase 26 [Morella rubra]
MYSNTDIDYGFYNFSAGENSDKVNSLHFVEGTRPDECRRCLNLTSYDLLQFCPNQKEAINGADECSLRYSTDYIWRHGSNPLTAFYNNANVSNVEGSTRCKTLVSSLIKRAASGILYKFALEACLPRHSKRYMHLWSALLIWTSLNAANCLAAAQQFIPQCCDGKQGGKYVTPSCDLRYEVYQFYDPAAEAPPPLTSTPSPPPPQQLVPPLSPPPIKALPPTEGWY